MDTNNTTAAPSGLSDAARYPESDTPRTDAFCKSLQHMGNWERWQKTASFAADIEQENSKLRLSLVEILNVCMKCKWALPSQFTKKPKAARDASSASDCSNPK